jgi:hypothetical protein
MGLLRYLRGTDLLEDTSAPPEGETRSLPRLAARARGVAAMYALNCSSSSGAGLIGAASRWRQVTRPRSLTVHPGEGDRTSARRSSSRTVAQWSLGVASTDDRLDR